MPEPRFPVYVVSRGRADSRLTVKALDQMRVPYWVVVEEDELEDYAAVIDRAKLLVLDPAFKAEYETCDDLGDSKSKGPGPARNFAWEHARAAGAAWHWVLDDNIRAFYRLNNAKRLYARTGTVLWAMEEFVGRFDNVALAGPQYVMFAPENLRLPPFITNTRIYSCLLIRNDLPYRWRCRYNEDTDLSLRALKDGWTTVEFNAFLQDKVWTQRVRGGNTAAFYASEGTLPKSRMLVRMHPDVTTLVRRFDRWHHEVNYRRFRTPLHLRPDVVLPDEPNEFGMELRQVRPEIRSPRIRALLDADRARARST